MNMLPAPLAELAQRWPRVAKRVRRMFAAADKRGMREVRAVHWVLNTIEDEASNELAPLLNVPPVTYARVPNIPRYARAKQAEQDNQVTRARLSCLLSLIKQIRCKYAISRAAPAALTPEVPPCKPTSTPVRQ